MSWVSDGFWLKKNEVECIDAPSRVNGNNSNNFFSLHLNISFILAVKEPLLRHPATIIIKNLLQECADVSVYLKVVLRQGGRTSHFDPERSTFQASCPIFKQVSIKHWCVPVLNHLCPSINQLKRTVLPAHLSLQFSLTFLFFFFF